MQFGVFSRVATVEIAPMCCQHFGSDEEAD
jgi:hypothetical protein